MTATHGSEPLLGVSDLSNTPEVAHAMAPTYERLRAVIPEIERPVHAPLIAAIN